jgi:hypothetical protein
MKSFSIHDYFEDETGAEISMAEIGPTLTGDPNTVLVPCGMGQYHIDYMLVKKAPVPVAEITLSTDEIRLFGYFLRDFGELRASALMKDGAGTLSMGGTLPALPNDDCQHQTAVTDDEIRSCTTIFRRLYMETEPANFVKAAALFEKTLGTHPLGKWVKAVADEYETHLQGMPELHFFMQGTTITFNVKRLIDVFLYTQYAHQPDEKRQRQFMDCLQQVGGKRNLLTWLFLNELWTCGLEIGNAGKVIAGWFKSYCDHHGVTPNVLKSLRVEHTGLGAAEKEEVRTARLFSERVEKLESELWKQAGKPEGGPARFHEIALQQLKQALNGEEVNTELFNAHVGRTANSLNEVQQPGNRKLNVRVNPVWNYNRLHAQMRLFNSGDRPIYIESWWEQWGPNGMEGGCRSVETIRGRLPIRLEEHDATELLIRVSSDVESLSGIGVFDGDQRLWLATDENLTVFKHTAIAHRLPVEPAEEPPLEGVKVDVKACATRPAGMVHDRFEVTFTNLSDRAISLVGARLGWTYTPPREMPKLPGKPSASEVGGNVTLSRQGKPSPIRPGEHVLFVLDKDMAVFLVEIARGDVRDEDIVVEFAAGGKMGWKAAMDEIPTVVRTVAKSIIESMRL